MYITKLIDSNSLGKTANIFKRIYRLRMIMTKWGEEKKKDQTRSNIKIQVETIDFRRENNMDKQEMIGYTEKDLGGLWITITSCKNVRAILLYSQEHYA